MPIYEFFCPKNQRIYSFFARSLRYADITPRCPDNAKWKLEKMVSGFAITGRAKDPAEAPAAPADPDGLDDPRMERLMAEMEREFSSTDMGDNPDPRMLAHMLRRVSEMGGEKIPREMQEMITRLEKGEDPEKIEADYGDLDSMGADATPEVREALAKIRARKPRITRDPTLYEMADFCDE